MCTKIKVCGLINKKDIEIVNECKIEYAGFVLFVPKSKRNLTIEEGKILIKDLNPSIGKVAVTISPTKEQVLLIQEAGFDYIQIHGRLTEDTYKAINIPIIRAFNGNEWKETNHKNTEQNENTEQNKNIEQNENNKSNKNYKNNINKENENTSTKSSGKVIGYVYDALVPGSGQTCDWSMVSSIPRNGDLLILAGGLNSSNINEAIHYVKPDVVDVSSGVEGEYGKDEDKIKEFVRMVRNGK